VPGLSVVHDGSGDCNGIIAVYLLRGSFHYSKLLP
jgi:hypothetical protein